MKRLAFIILILVGCGSDTKTVTVTEVEADTVIVTLRDTVVRVEKDTVIITLSDTVVRVETEEYFLLYQDIYGVVEYENDGDYPPPDNLDNLADDNIMVTLYFGESIDFYRENDVYGYFVSYEGQGSNVENFNFPFVPSGDYWLSAEFTSLDSCFRVNTSKFFHSETSATFRELRPGFIGLNVPCWSVYLAGASDMVQISKNCWVTRAVYDHIYEGAAVFPEIARRHL